MGTDVALWPGFTNPADTRNVTTGSTSGANSYTISTAETLTTSDLVVRTFVGSRSGVDAVLGTEMVARTATISRNPIEITGTTDAAIRQTTLLRAVTESISGLIDMVTRVFISGGPVPPVFEPSHGRTLDNRWHAPATSRRWTAVNRPRRMLATMPTTPQYTATAHPSRWVARVMENRA